jgi:hypothetical protein
MKGRAHPSSARRPRRVTYQVGRHVLALLRKIRKSPLFHAIWFSVWIAIFATGAIKCFL